MDSTRRRTRPRRARARPHRLQRPQHRVLNHGDDDRSRTRQNRLRLARTPAGTIHDRPRRAPSQGPRRQPAHTRTCATLRELGIQIVRHPRRSHPRTLGRPPPHLSPLRRTPLPFGTIIALAKYQRPNRATPASNRPPPIRTSVDVQIAGVSQKQIGDPNLNGSPLKPVRALPLRPAARANPRSRARFAKSRRARSIPALIRTHFH